MLWPGYQKDSYSPWTIPKCSPDKSRGRSSQACQYLDAWDSAGTLHISEPLLHLPFPPRRRTCQFPHPLPPLPCLMRTPLLLDLLPLLLLHQKSWHSPSLLTKPRNDWMIQCTKIMCSAFSTWKSSDWLETTITLKFVINTVVWVQGTPLCCKWNCVNSRIHYVLYYHQGI